MSAASFMAALPKGCAHVLRRPPPLLPVPSRAVPSRLESSQVVAAARIPRRVKLSAGRRYAWCACGHSKKQPFCDGAHRTAAPQVGPLRFTAEQDGAVLLCACKQTGSALYCDGTHLKVAYRDLLAALRSFFK